MEMRQVSQEVFYATLYADPRDIMPRIVGRYGPAGYLQVWRDKNGRIFGKTLGGEYWLAQ